MHAALRLGSSTHVARRQPVNEEHLQFDFLPFQQMSDEEELATVEKQVNEKIQGVPWSSKTMPKDEAIALGAMALLKNTSVAGW